MGKTLSGASGTWRKLQKEGVGTEVKCVFVSFEPERPSPDPKYGPQAVLTVEVDGKENYISCPTALKRIFTMNQVVPGTNLLIRYKGEKKGKGPKPFHDFDVIDLDQD